ncbi:sulfotransferase family 2 domain-containing protein [Cognatishimia sp. SS12]|uniref:sulfotransferase family 2 domain-containing protein n=1 Tax=Cognatishimia sp. SS12 TaxID=2979465 RepID=UPI00232C204D|nr:sulfotransferase family 2 domain-containing protein [Cognatishimia sp. SS12]MDC0736722.1 sulfotransferase family 2 domain-containing protein [Cognatishimia sp. SS12]
MIVSRGRRYIFVHIPKTGGTALSLALEARAMKDDIMMGDTPKAVRRRRRTKGVQAAGRLWKHSTLSDIDGMVTPEEVQAFFTFTLVRNPWDRLVSYFHWLREQKFEHTAVILAKSLTFKEFLLHPHTQMSLRNMPYGRYVTSIDGQEACDLFIRLEAFETDAAPLFDHLGFALDLPHVNASERGKDHRAYYDEETAAIVETICAQDIVRFGYQF